MAIPNPTLTGSSANSARQSASVAAPKSPARDGSARRVLLVGPDAIALREQFPTGVTVESVESFLEAVLVLGPEAAVDVIIAGVCQDIDEIERAVSSIRKVAGNAKLYLLCEPVDEPACRHARAWGADDYFVLPVAKATLERLVLRPAEALATRISSLTSPAQALRSTVELAVAQIPLMVQSVMVTNILDGRADFVERAVATLQAYMRWPGRLRFEQAGLAQATVEGTLMRAAVATHGMTFGNLLLETPAPEDNATASQLDQAAMWLAGWMALVHRNEQLRTLAITDELSGAYNRRYFKRFTADLLERAKVERFRTSILLFDIDNFKKYNDLYGHAAGDRIIVEVIRLLRTCTRPHDLVARLGGDEFAVVFWDNEPPRQPGSQHPKDAVTATERFRKVLATHDWKKGCNIQGEISISGGLAGFPWDGETVDTLMAKADAALLRAKAAGKNAIILHESPEDRAVREELENQPESR